MKLVHQYIAIFVNFSLTSNHFHPLQVENCDSNSRLVVDEDDYGKLRLERVNETALLLVFRGIPNMQHVVLGWDTQTKCNAHVSCLYIITNSF